MHSASTVTNTTGRRLRVLVVDDESFNRARLETLLEHEVDVEVVGQASDGLEAVEAIRTLSPDLVLLDIQMPGMSGIDLVREIGPNRMPATIFVTAYDRYAVEAFELAALDYLVKPFDDERFAQALNRARRAIAADDLHQIREQLTALVRAAPAGPPADGVSIATSRRYLERIAVDVHGSIRPIQVSDIDYIVSDGPYAELYVGGKRYIIREALQTLEERLDPQRFMRVHRSVILRLDLVESLKRGDGGDGEVVLKSGVKLRVSRTRRESLERWLGLTH